MDRRFEKATKGYPQKFSCVTVDEFPEVSEDHNPFEVQAP